MRERCVDRRLLFAIPIAIGNVLFAGRAVCEFATRVARFRVQVWLHQRELRYECFPSVGEESPAAISSGGGFERLRFSSSAFDLTAFSFSPDGYGKWACSCFS